MRSAKNFLWATLLVLPFLFLNSTKIFAAAASDADDYVPEVTARVARISFLRGDVQIKRAGEPNWEHGALNLPIVEGDEITTGESARLEIQFDSRQFLRLAENSYLKITTLKDEGIAVSLPQGSLSLRVLEFDKTVRYFEIDAPKTTVAVERAGMYRVDAGDSRKSELRVTVTGDGEARIYSQDSGFLLRSGRSTRLFLDGNYAGEYETTDAARYADDFDAWASERDTAIAKRLQNAGYDKYYDRDIYGAEDLNDYGEWIYTHKYGYVWRPFPSAVGNYVNWSPYRYGQWRWIPPYGWTWVGDESWGWATYHHGRWVYADRSWVWTPYGHYRSARSWWQPALVVVTYSGNTICWYPLPYDYGYYNYNSNYYSTYIDRRRQTTIINNNITNVIVNPTPAPTPVVGINNPRFKREPPVYEVPPTGVVSVDASEFGRKTKGFMTPPVEIANRVLSRTPVETEAPPILPTYQELNGKVSGEIQVENPRAEKIGRRLQTGAGERNAGAPLDDNLRQERIFGNRPPIQRTPPSEVKTESENTQTRDTGAVKRQPPRSGIIREDNSQTQENTINNFPVRRRGGKIGNNENTENNSEQQTPPVSAEPPQSERRERRQKPPEQQQQPPPPRIEPRSEPPQRESRPPQPENNAPPKQQPREEKPPERRIEPAPPARERVKTTDKDG